MPYIDDKKYDRLAKDAVDAFTEDEVPLNDSVYKYAEAEGLLPDQVKQLVWRTNTLAHLTLFEKQAEDKNVEFEVADAQEILSRLYNNTEEKTASAYTTRAKERTVDFFTLPVGGGDTEKTAAVEPMAIPPFDDAMPMYASDRKDEAVLAARKIASELENRVYAAREDYYETLNTLEYELKKLASHPTDSDRVYEFAHEAYTAHRDAGERVLADLSLGVNAGMRKTAALADLSDPLHLLFKRAVDARTDVFKNAAALELLEKKLNGRTR